jgi:hypothetical protein
MRLSYCMLLVIAVGLVGCGRVGERSEHARGLTAEQRAGAEDGARRFVLQVAQDVTRDGPAAWRGEFADSPAFFMASEGKLVFPTSQAATQGIDSFAHITKRIELHWGDDLKIDVLTPELAVVGTTWHEVRDDTEGHHVEESGYFTGLVEKRNGKWEFRDAHWSVPGPPASAQ